MDLIREDNKHILDDHKIQAMEGFYKNRILELGVFSAKLRHVGIEPFYSR